MTSDATNLKWIESTGGPLIMLSKKLLPVWGGYDESKNLSDYDRACQIKEYLGEIKVGDSKGVVFGNMPMRTTWLGNDYIVVRWMSGESEAQVESFLQQIPSELWKDHGIEIELNSDTQYLFDSASDGVSVEDDHLLINLPEGKYLIKTAEYKPDPETHLILHKFFKQ